MKKYILLLLLLCSAFSLYAQSDKAFVYVLPVTGTGSKPEDNDFFYNRLISEVTLQNFTLVKSLKEAQFYLVGTLFPHLNNANRSVKQYVFHLLLAEIKTNETKSEGELVYETPPDVSNLFPVLVHTLLYTIPEEKGKNNWRNKTLYAGGSAFWTPRVYTATDVSTNIANFGFGFFAEYHVLDFLSVGLGFEGTIDSVKRSASATQTHRNALLEIPVLVKYVYKPGDFFLLEPYVGVQLNIAFFKTTTPAPVSWLTGIEAGFKVGPGILFIDPRFSMDIGKSTLHADIDIPFQRYIIHLGVGYKFGFFTRD